MAYFRFGVRLAISFFITGTAILVLFYFNPTAEVARLAYQFVLVAIVANWIYVLFLLLNLLRAKISITLLLKTLGILALNVPVGILYASIMKWLSNH